MMGARLAMRQAKRLAAALVLVGGAPRLAFADVPARAEAGAPSVALEARATEQFRAGVRRYEAGDLQGAAAAFAVFDRDSLESFRTHEILTTLKDTLYTKVWQVCAAAPDDINHR